VASSNVCQAPSSHHLEPSSLEAFGISVWHYLDSIALGAGGVITGGWREAAGCAFFAAAAPTMSKLGSVEARKGREGSEV